MPLIFANICNGIKIPKDKDIRIQRQVYVHFCIYFSITFL